MKRVKSVSHVCMCDVVFVVVVVGLIFNQVEKEEKLDGGNEFQSPRLEAPFVT